MPIAAFADVKSCTSIEFREFKSRFYDDIPEAGYRSTYGDRKLLLETSTYPETSFKSDFDPPQLFSLLLATA